jgi:hypothetical protein
MATKTPPKTAPSKYAQPAKAAAPVAKPVAPVAAPAAKPVAPAAKAAAPAVKARATYQPKQEEIAARAYEIYQREGGNDHDNWLRAERELIARGPR